VCHSEVPANLLLQYYHTLYTQTLAFVKPLNINEKIDLNAKCHTLATPVAQLPFVTVETADRWWTYIQTNGFEPHSLFALLQHQNIYVFPIC
jgi:hypothetical protein